MTIFKTKTAKKGTDRKLQATLDNIHDAHVKEFHNDEVCVIPALQKKIKYHKRELKDPTLDISQVLDLQDAIQDLKRQIKELQDKKQKYFLDNSQYIFEYFENKKNIIKEDSGKMDNSIVERFFGIAPKTTPEAPPTPPAQRTNNATSIVQKYLCNISDSYIDMSHYMFPVNVCPNCTKGEMVIVEDDGIMLCGKCFKTTPFLIENEKPSYKEPPKEISSYAYKRSNHFKEILAQFQGKQTTTIPDAVISNIRNQIQKERIQLQNVNTTITKNILKKLGYNKYYEHINFINNIFGVKPPTMSFELEEKLCNLFNEIQTPYAKYCPKDRVNFLNYYYTLYKLCELLNESSYLAYIPMLKDNEKINEQDVIWKNICSDLQWKFIPTNNMGIFVSQKY